MEMRLKKLNLMLLTVAVTAMLISGQVPVFLNKTQQRVSSGSMLALHCCLSTSGYQRYRISWYYSGPSVNNSKQLGTWINKPKNTSVDDCQDINKTYILAYVNETHSGWYFCEVTGEIPSLTNIQSNGTWVVVSDMHTTNTPLVTITEDLDVSSGNQWMWIVLGVSSFVLLVLLVICVFYTRRHHGTRGEEPIYINTRNPNKQPSPRPGMQGDSLKTASSSQNLRTSSPAGRYDEGKRRYKH